MKIISRTEAIEKKSRYYFTGKPCKHGHVSMRYVTGHTCVECACAASAANNRDNPEAVSAYNAEYRSKNAELIKIRSGRYKG